MYYKSFKWPNEFFDNDIRNCKKTQWQSYRVSEEIFQHRCGIPLPPERMKDARVLDLGSYLGTAGYWALAHGCKEFVGVELIPDSVEKSRQYLSTYFDSGWEIKHQSVQDYINTTNEKFDVVIAWGIFNSFTDPIAMLEKICTLGPYIVIDSPIPNLICNESLDEEKVAMVEINPYSAMMPGTISNPPVTFSGTRISLHAIELIGLRCGFRLNKEPYNLLKQAVPENYGINSEAHRSVAVLEEDLTLVKSTTYLDIYGI